MRAFFDAANNHYRTEEKSCEWRALVFLFCVVWSKVKFWTLFLEQTMHMHRIDSKFSSHFWKLFVFFKIDQKSVEKKYCWWWWRSERSQMNFPLCSSDNFREWIPHCDEIQFTKFYMEILCTMSCIGNGKCTTWIGLKILTVSASMSSQIYYTVSQFNSILTQYIKCSISI